MGSTVVSIGEPNMITYSAVIGAREKGEMPKRALQLFEEMQQKGLQPNVITYRTHQRLRKVG